MWLTLTFPLPHRSIIWSEGGVGGVGGVGAVGAGGGTGGTGGAGAVNSCNSPRNSFSNDVPAMGAAEGAAVGPGVEYPDGAAAGRVEAAACAGAGRMAASGRATHNVNTTNARTAPREMGPRRNEGFSKATTRPSNCERRAMASAELSAG